MVFSSNYFMPARCRKERWVGRSLDLFYPVLQHVVAVVSRHPRHRPPGLLVSVLPMYSSSSSRLKKLCDDEGVAFIDTWDHFVEQPYLFRDDGLHLNEVGSAHFWKTAERGNWQLLAKKLQAREGPRQPLTTQAATST